MKHSKTKVMQNLLAAILVITSLSVISTAAAARAIMTYTVPKGESMAVDAVVELVRAKFRITGNLAKLDYALPFELDGTTPHRFILTGEFQGSVWRMSSADGSVRADCEGDARDFSCRMVYEQNSDGLFLLDVASANAYLETRTDLNLEQISFFQDAQRVLSHEAIGIVKSKKH